MKQIIAIIWRAGSGKDLAWDYISQTLGIPSFTISEALRISARERWISESRENLIALGKEFAEKYGDDYLSKVIIENTQAEKIVITWMRQIWQLEYCKNNHDTLFLWIESDSHLRYNRLLWNNKFSGSYEDFIQVEKLDEGDIQNVTSCLRYCSKNIENNGSVDEFENNLKNILWKNQNT